MEQVPGSHGGGVMRWTLEGVPKPLPSIEVWVLEI